MARTSEVRNSVWHLNGLLVRIAPVKHDWLMEKLEGVSDPDDFFTGVTMRLMEGATHDGQAERAVSGTQRFPAMLIELDYLSKLASLFSVCSRNAGRLVVLKVAYHQC